FQTVHRCHGRLPTRLGYPDRPTQRPVLVTYRLGLTAFLMRCANWFNLPLISSVLPSRRSLSLPVALPAVCFAVPLVTWALYLTARTMLLMLAFTVMATVSSSGGR